MSLAAGPASAGPAPFAPSAEPKALGRAQQQRGKWRLRRWSRVPRPPWGNMIRTLEIAAAVRRDAFLLCRTSLARSLREYVWGGSMWKQLLLSAAVALFSPSFAEAHGLGGVHTDPAEVQLEIETIGKRCLELVFATLTSVDHDEMGRVRKNIRPLDEASMDRISKVYSPHMNEEVVAKTFQSAGNAGSKVGFSDLDLYGGNAYIRTHAVRVSSHIYGDDGQSVKQTLYNLMFDCIYDPDLVEVIDIKLVR